MHTIQNGFHFYDIKIKMKLGSKRSYKLVNITSSIQVADIKVGKEMKRIIAYLVAVRYKLL